MKEQVEPLSPKSMTSKIWSCANSKAKKNNWHFAPKKLRGNLPELSPKIKPTTFGSKIYRLGPYEGTLEELKEFAAMKGMTRLTNGAVSYKVA